MKSSQDQMVGGMATFPARFETLADVVGSIAPQLDKLYVYINQSDEIPKCLTDFDNVVALLGRDHDGDLSATGKVYPLKLVSEDCYYFTLDDDFIYPPNYASRMKEALDLFERRAAVSVHGSIFAPEADWYYERSRAFGSLKGLEKFHFVTLPGSGTAAFHRGSLKLNYEDFPQQPMVDLQLAISALQQGMPWLAIPRDKGWLKFLGHEGLWQDSVAKMTHHTVAMLNAGPWSFDRFRPFYEEFVSSLSNQAIDTLEERALTCLREGKNRPWYWGVTKQTKESRERHEKLLDELLNRERPKPKPVSKKPRRRARKWLLRNYLIRLGLPQGMAERIANAGSRAYSAVRIHRAPIVRN